MPTPSEVVRRLIEGVAAERFSELARLYAKETDVTHPFNASVKPLRTRGELEKHFAAMATAQARLPKRDVIDLVIHQTTDPELVVAEFAYRWNLQEPIKVGCVLVARVRAGEIVESRDYFDPSALANVADLLRVP